MHVSSPLKDAGVVTNRYGAHMSVAGGTIALFATCIAIYLSIGVADAFKLKKVSSFEV